MSLSFSSHLLLSTRLKDRINSEYWIIIQDMLWVMGSIYLLAANPFLISPMGHYIIAVIAAVVFIMAINQSVALIKGRK